MLLKTKVLFSLASVGVLGSTGAGVYYGVKKNKDDGAQNSKETQKGSAKLVTPQLPVVPGTGTADAGTKKQES